MIKVIENDNDQMTLEECVKMHEKMGVSLIISAGHIVAFVVDDGRK